VLIKGKDGEDGKIHINVVRDGQAVERYTNRYYLEVKGFDVVDENEDGINEPGEWLYVKNIEIQNRGRLFLLEEKYLAITNPFIGQMSTPKTSSVTVMVRETEWLQPDSQEVLHIPPDVQPGQTVTLPGSLRASIKNESRGIFTSSMRLVSWHTLSAHLHRFPSFMEDNPSSIHILLLLKISSTVVVSPRDKLQDSLGRLDFLYDSSSLYLV